VARRRKGKLKASPARRATPEVTRAEYRVPSSRPCADSSPINARVAARNIAIGLVENDPKGKEVYDENLSMLVDEIDARLFGEGCVPKIVLAVKIALSRQLLPPTLRHPFSKAPIAQGFDRDQHNLWDTTFGEELVEFLG
jgi:hypothetical protein